MCPLQLKYSIAFGILAPPLLPARSARRDNAGVESSTKGFREFGSPAIHTASQYHATFNTSTFTPLSSTCISLYRSHCRTHPALTSGSINLNGSLNLHPKKRASRVPCMRIVRLHNASKYMYLLLGSTVIIVLSYLTRRRTTGAFSQFRD